MARPLPSAQRRCSTAGFEVAGLLGSPTSGGSLNIARNVGRASFFAKATDSVRTMSSDNGR